MYDLWKLLPDKINNEEPFYTLNYAGDCLSYGDEYDVVNYISVR